MSLRWWGCDDGRDGRALHPVRGLARGVHPQERDYAVCGGAVGLFGQIETYGKEINEGISSSMHDCCLKLWPMGRTVFLFFVFFCAKEYMNDEERR